MLRKLTMTIVAFLFATLPAMADTQPPAPLPKGTVVVQADATVPKEFAQFLGIWKGPGHPVGLIAFAVTNVNAKGEVSCIYAWSIGGEIGYTGPAVGKIKGGVLTVPEPYPGNKGIKLVARFNGNALDLAYLAKPNFEQHMDLQKSK